ncbi:Hsp70 family protein [Kutzneria albida]|uniref:Uncharacterized protein n=1 Tax=Kutzneria albida DSM 43870 TaxID=1449976 RepID=W5WB99_9PSEU|nr:Hsp70 family protein [Kutzneria albida]AHH95499.1 hypothetical protein KALB_2130 [Kutzneria albida DSM 43870]
MSRSAGSYALGIDIGASATAVALTRRDGVVWSPAKPLGLGIAGDRGLFAAGDAALPGQEAVAHLVLRTVQKVAESEQGLPERVAVTHPIQWGPYRIDLVHRALRELGLLAPVLVPEPLAAVAGTATWHRLDSAARLLVHDIGGGKLTATVLRGTGGARFEVLGRPIRSEALAGSALDEAVIGLLSDESTALAGESGEQLDQLRVAAVAAKHALSEGRDPGVAVSGADFEAAIRPTVDRGVELAERALAAARTSPEELTAVVLVGGSARIPLVRTLLGERLRVPVLVDRAPETITAVGAATIAALAPPRERAGSSIAETVIMADPSEETVILFPTVDPDSRPAIDVPPQRPPAEVKAPQRGSVRRRPMTKRGAAIGLVTAALVAVSAWLVQQYLNPTPPPAPPSVSSTAPGAGGP